MTIKWNLKKYLQEKHSIRSATELRKVVMEKTGVTISLQNVCNLMNKKPSSIRLETMEIICTSLNCRLEAFCQITARQKGFKSTRKLSYQNTPHSKRGLSQFPDPEDYQF